MTLRRRAKVRIRRLFLGERLRDEKQEEEKFSVRWGMPIFASDAISSVSYAGEEMLLVLLPVLGIAAYRAFLPLLGAVLLLLGILTVHFYQVIHAYPRGGGPYSVAMENLGETSGLLAGASLVVDYVLTAAVSSCAGAATITAAFPGLEEYRVLIAFAILFLFTWIHLRGVRESSVLFGVPTYFFVFTMLALIVTGFVRHSLGYAPALRASAAPVPDLAAGAMTLLLFRAFAYGCTAVTGVEAVANAVPNFLDPSVHRARKTLLIMSALLFTIFLGTGILMNLYRVVPAGSTSALGLLAGAVFGQESAMYYVVLLMTALVLLLGANTAYADLPHLMAHMAHNGYLPRQFLYRGTKLAYTNGVLFLSVAAALLVFLFQGDQHKLLPLYEIGVFIAFFLSLLGMTVYWRKQSDRGWQWKAVVNGLGALVCGVTLLLVVEVRFLSGGWVTLLALAVMVYVMRHTQRHYGRISGDLLLCSMEEARELLDKAFTGKVIVPVQSVSRTFIQTLQCARSCGFTEIEFYNVNNSEEKALALKEQLESLGVPGSFVYDITPYRDVEEVLLRHIRQEAAALPEHGHLTVMVGTLILKDPWKKRLLHNEITNSLEQSMVKYPNVSVFKVPYHAYPKGYVFNDIRPEE